MIIPSACAAVAVLATAAKCVDGFSTTSPLLSEGWRRSSSISMAYENESVSAATTVTAVADNEESARRRMLAARLQTQKYESSLSIDQDDDSDEDNSEETTSEVVSIETNEEMMLDTNNGTTEQEEEDEEEEYIDEIETAAEDTNDDDDDQEEEETKETPADSIQSSGGANTQRGLDLEIISIMAGEIAQDVLSVLRFGAANFLTQSLPEDQRQDLLKRMGAAPALPPTTTITKSGSNEATVFEAAAEMVNEKVQEERASIQEEIAVARAEEAQKSEKNWERQKEGILSEMTNAANARVENELKIQKMKLEEETTKVLQEKEKEIEAERERLGKVIQEEKEKMEALAAASAAEAVEVEALFAVGTDEEVARNKELLEKKQNQQAALEVVEEDLRASVSSEEGQRDLLQAMLQKRQGQQKELDVVEADLRKQVAEIESEKSRYQLLVADLKGLKGKEQGLRQDAEQTSGDSSSDVVDVVVHPVLGPVIADLGYKRIHFVSSGRLGTIPVWNRNRTYRNNRAKSMATEKIKSMELGFPGAICLHEAPTGKLSIVDGQHRVGMMSALKETINKKLEKGDDIGTLKDTDAIFERVLVEVYPEPKLEEGEEPVGDGYAEQVFSEINKAEPVKLIDMPGVASKVDRQIITDGVETLKEQYGGMFSPSQRCRLPNVNVDNLRSAIFGANLLKRHKLTTSKKLTDWLLKQNAALGDEYEKTDPSKQKLISKKQWTKASSSNFYLGLESSWLYK